MKKLFLLCALAGILWTGTVYATNITISDNNYTNETWHQDQENDEVEPGMSHGQDWDLEGFFLNGTQLSLVGGYNFKDGYKNTSSGDIFIDVDGDAVYGYLPGDTDGNLTVNKTYGYDYVLDLDWQASRYNVWKIDETTEVETAYYKENQGSSPWRYVVSDGTPILTDVEFEYNAGTTSYDDEFGDRGEHNELIVDLRFLLDDLELDEVEFIAHYTMGCGNDNLMGKGVIPNPEPATMLLLGFGLIGIAGLYRKKQK